MVGRAALGDPWLFSGREVTTAEAARFLLEYHDAMQANGAGARGAIARVKQLVRTWRAGALLARAGERESWLRERDPEALADRLRRLSEPAHRLAQ